MQIEYEISEQDFLQAQKLGLKKTPNRTTRIIFRVLPFWGLFLFLIIMWSVLQHGFAWHWNMLVTFAFAFFCLSSPLLMKRVRKKIYRQQASLQGKRSVTVDDTGISIVAPASSLHLEWKIFQRFIEDDKTFLLYQSNLVFHFIPKRELSQEQIAELREVLTRNIARS